MSAGYRTSTHFLPWTPCHAASQLLGFAPHARAFHRGLSGGLQKCVLLERRAVRIFWSRMGPGGKRHLSHSPLLPGPPRTHSIHPDLVILVVGMSLYLHSSFLLSAPASLSGYCLAQSRQKSVPDKWVDK